MSSTISHLKYILFFPKIGPDMYFTHWLLFFKPSRIWFQRRKLKAIGENSEIRPYSVLDGTHNISIGKNVIIPYGTHLITNTTSGANSTITIEDDVLFGPNSAVYATTHLFQNPTIPIKNQGYRDGHTLIKQGAWIGINTVIMPGVIIGKNAVVGANSVVTKDVPDYAIVAGAPAKILRYTHQ
jgi:acetyltransferase-like isoleucine patch superfamily enzyme